MYSIVYHSTESPDITAEDISNILETARVFNKKKGITGCLIYHNHRFIQVLEGDRKILEELYSTIKRDKRHSNVNTIYEDFTSERNFNIWSMGFIDLSSAHDDTKERELFESNLITYCELVRISEESSAAFWKEVKLILESNSLHKS